MGKTRVSEILNNDVIRTWNPGDIITIKAGTGAGKSRFIKSTLYAFAEYNNKKILMLIHRSDCVNQFQMEIENDKKTDVIDIKTYQKLECKELNKYVNDLNEYQYIVCDEFHYFMSDAAFNKTTDISLNLILEQTSAIRIFMSATGDDMKKYINDIKKLSTIDYEIPITYDFIKTLTFFNKDESMEKFIDESIEKNEKGIFFIQSAKKAYNIYKKYEKYCLFNCSKANKDYYKFVDKDKIADMLKNEKFDENILITTTCMDAGININDVKVKHIIVDVKDIGSLIQCIGRKRLENQYDKINIYVKAITNKQLGGMKSILKQKIRMADYLENHTVKELLNKYPRQKDIYNIIYDDTVEEDNKCTKKINELMYYKCKLDIDNIEIMKSYGNFGYCKYLANLFGFVNKKGYPHYRLIDEDYKEDLNDYLDSIVGKKLLKEDKKNLKEEFNNAGLKDRTMGINTLNGKLIDEEMPFVIKSNTDWNRILEDGSRNPLYAKSYWMVLKLVSNI